MSTLSAVSCKTMKEPRISCLLRASTQAVHVPSLQRLWLTLKSLLQIGVPHKRTSRIQYTQSLIKKFSTHPRGSLLRLRKAMHSNSHRTLWLAVACSSLGNKDHISRVYLQNRSKMTMFRYTARASSSARTLVLQSSTSRVRAREGQA